MTKVQITMLGLILMSIAGCGGSDSGKEGAQTSSTASSSSSSSSAKSSHIEAISISSDGTIGNAPSTRGQMSGDGRFVVFTSEAENLVPQDNNGWSDIFVRDRFRGTTQRISLAIDGSEGNRGSDFGSISDDGRYVAFASSASNLVPAFNNLFGDIYLRDLETNTTTVVSKNRLDSDSETGSSYAPVISGNGRYIAFLSDATDLITDDNRIGETYRRREVFIYDRQTGIIKKVSVASDGTQSDGTTINRPSISYDGSLVAFESNASNLVAGDTNGHYDVFVHDCISGKTSRVSKTNYGGQGNNWSGMPSISGNGLVVTFSSKADNLTDNDNNGMLDVFVHHMGTHTTTRISVASDGSEGNGYSDYPVISKNGQYIAFESTSSNLVDGDSAYLDAFVHDITTGSTTLIDIAADGAQAVSGVLENSLDISDDGKLFVFSSSANLENNQLDFWPHVYIAR